MQNKILFKRSQKGIAFTAIVSFLLMPVNMAVAANNITAGNSGIGGMTNITGGQGNVTDITSGFVQNGTGMNHFGNFDIGAGGIANMIGADRYINMVDKGININGTLNAFTSGKLPANVMFISPEGMAVGAGGILNVGGLQMINTNVGDYNSLIQKAGTLDGNNITLTEADITNLKAGGDGFIQIGGKIYSTGDVVLQAGNGIYFKDGGIIDTTATIDSISGIGDITLFTNTGDIVGSSQVNIDSSGNLTLIAQNGGIGQGLDPNPAIYGEQKSVTPLNVKIAEGKKLNVQVSDEISQDASFKGYASIANHSIGNLNLGNVKGSNVKIAHKGAGSIITNEAISNVDSIYLNAEKGALQVNHDITAKNIVRLNGKAHVDAVGNLKVTDNGYISVYSESGSIDMNDATLQMGNIDIKAKGGDVSHGNITIVERGDAEGTLRLQDNSKLSTGIKAPDTFRFDGVHITSVDGNVVQKDGTVINSAGRVDLTAGGTVNHTVKAADLISVNAGSSATINAMDTARIGDVSASKININGSDLLIDGKVKGSSVNIQSTDKVTIRPNTALDADHRTYGAVESTIGDVNINAQNGIFATEQRPEGAMIISAGNANLVSTGDIKTISGTDSSISISAADRVNAKGNNINIYLADKNGGVGLIDAVANANIGASGDVNIYEKINAGNDVVVKAVGNVMQNITGVSIAAGNDISLTSTGANVGLVNGFLTVDADNTILAEAADSIYIAGIDDLNILSAVAGKDAVFQSPKNITISSAKTGGNLTLDSGASISAVGLSVGGNLSADAVNNVIVDAISDLTISEITAGNNVTVKGFGNILQAENAPAIKAGNDLVIASRNQNIGSADNYLTVDLGGVLDAAAENGSIYIAGVNDLNVISAAAGKDAALSANNNLTITNTTAGQNVNLNAGNDIAVAIANAGKNIDVNATGNVVVGNILDAGENLSVNAGGNIAQTLKDKVAFKSGKEMNLVSKDGNVGAADKYLTVEVGGKLNANAEKGNVYIGTPKDLVIGQINSGKDAFIIGDASIKQAGSKPAITTGNNLNIISNNSDIGAADNYLSVKVGNALDAKAANGSIYIEGLDDLNINKVEAGKDVGLKAQGNLHQTADFDFANPSIISGGNMTLASLGNNVGDPNNYLSVNVGGILNASAPNGGVYIGSDNNLTIGQVAAGKDVGIEANGFIHQTDNGARPAIIAGEDLHLLSNNDNVGDPNNYLTVQVGDRLDAHAPNGGVYIYGYGDLTVDKIEAGKDVGLGGNKDIIIPHDREEGNIVAGGNVKIEAGDSVLNGGGENVGIVAENVEIIANLNQKDEPGSIGELPYNDLNHSINVIINGEVKADEIGVPDSNKILNIHIMGQDDGIIGPSDGNGFNSDDVDDRDQRNMKILASDDPNNSASVRNHRQDLRYNVAASEYVLLSSNTDSGAKVQDVLNISKQGMLVKTNELPKVGENIQITMDYKGLPFTVDGQVVRANPTDNTAGIRFNNIDQFTSSMILYLGMMNGR